MKRTALGGDHEAWAMALFQWHKPHLMMHCLWIWEGDFEFISTRSSSLSFHGPWFSFSPSASRAATDYEKEMCWYSLLVYAVRVSVGHGIGRPVNVMTRRPEKNSRVIFFVICLLYGFLCFCLWYKNILLESWVYIISNTETCRPFLFSWYMRIPIFCLHNTREFLFESIWNPYPPVGFTNALSTLAFCKWKFEKFYKLKVKINPQSWIFGFLLLKQEI